MEAPSEDHFVKMNRKINMLKTGHPAVRDIYPPSVRWLAIISIKEKENEYD